MIVLKNHLIKGKHNKPIILDVFAEKNHQKKPVIIFCHGYKGYKDWGCWNQMALEFAKKGFCFVKFNFSYNGGTAEQPIDFPDLEAFAKNNFTKELDDLEVVIDFILSDAMFTNEIDKNSLSLMAHSRGGGIVLIKAAEDNRISKIVTLAGVSDFAMRFPKGEILEHWKKTGIIHVENARTKQQMPHHYQFYENFKANQNRLTIESAVKQLNIPYLIVHGTNDPTVLLKEAENLKQWNPKNTLEIIKDADHSFGSKHPWTEEKLPIHLSKAVKKAIRFLKTSL